MTREQLIKSILDSIEAARAGLAQLDALDRWPHTATYVARTHLDVASERVQSQSEEATP